MQVLGNFGKVLIVELPLAAIETSVDSCSPVHIFVFALETSIRDELI